MKGRELFAYAILVALSYVFFFAKPIGPHQDKRPVELFGQVFKEEKESQSSCLRSVDNGSLTVLDQNSFDTIPYVPVTDKVRIVCNGFQGAFRINVFSIWLQEYFDRKFPGKDYRVLVVPGVEQEKLQKICNRVNIGGCNTQVGTDTYIMYLNDYWDSGTILHELFHVVYQNTEVPSVWVGAPFVLFVSRGWDKDAPVPSYSDYQTMVARDKVAFDGTSITLMDEGEYELIRDMFYRTAGGIREGEYYP